MDPTAKSSLLWGVIGALAFLVLLQGYHLASDEFVGIEVIVGVAVLVGVVSGGLAHLLRPYFRRL